MTIWHKVFRIWTKKLIADSVGMLGFNCVWLVELGLWKTEQLFDSCSRVLVCFCAFVRKNNCILLHLRTVFKQLNVFCLQMVVNFRSKHHDLFKTRRRFGIGQISREKKVLLVDTVTVIFSNVQRFFPWQMRIFGGVINAVKCVCSYSVAQGQTARIFCRPQQLFISRKFRTRCQSCTTSAKRSSQGRSVSTCTEHNNTNRDINHFLTYLEAAEEGNMRMRGNYF